MNLELLGKLLICLTLILFIEAAAGTFLLVLLVVVAAFCFVLSSFGYSTPWRGERRV